MKTIDEIKEQLKNHSAMVFNTSLRLEVVAQRIFQFFIKYPKFENIDILAANIITVEMSKKGVKYYSLEKKYEMFINEDVGLIWGNFPKLDNNLRLSKYLSDKKYTWL